MGLETATKDNPSTDIGNRILFENDLVRVWELAVEPGTSKGWHRHDLPYVIVPMTDGKIEIESKDGHIVRPEGRGRQGDLARPRRNPRSAQPRQRRLQERAGRDQTAAARRSRRSPATAKGMAGETNGCYDNLLANVPTELWIGGKWRKASDNARFDVIDPATESR